MDILDYKHLYKLQDQVLAVLFSVEKEFYLTGGTCLSRFYQEKRYSDDLDFFTNNSPRYNFAVKNIKIALKKEFKLKISAETKNFTRIILNNILQVDLVNDTVSRFKDIVILDNGFLIDNIENILSNKITAVMGRDNPKDIFDIYLISRFYSICWIEILESAHEKAVFTNDELIIRLKTFPMTLLSKINVVDKNFNREIEQNFSNIIDKLSEASEQIIK